MSNHDNNWAMDAIIYQIFPDRFFNGDKRNDPESVESWGNPPTTNNYFGGDLQGIINKLDYLDELGVNCLYLNPIFKAGTNHRYDTIDYYQIDPFLGDPDVFRELISKMHEKKMRIILDGVFNHCGKGFWAFEDLRKNEEKSKYKDWFNVRYFPVSENPLNYDTCGGCYYLPKFNHQNEQLEKYLLDVAVYWLNEFGIDGWRLDTPARVPMSFWKKFHEKVREVSTDCYLVGELWRDAAQWVKGDLFDGCTNYLLRDLIVDFFSKRILDAEDFSFELDSLLSRLGTGSYYMMNLLGCHDTPRVRTLFKGEDLRLALAITFQMTFPGIPLIYYGDEIGMTGEGDPDCRRTMEWDDKKWNRDIYHLYRSMIRIRKDYKSLRKGTFQTLLAFNSLIAYKRVSGEEEFVVILNPGPAVASIRIPLESNSTDWFNVLSSQNTYHAENGCLFFEEFKSGDSVLLCNDHRN